MSTFELAGDVRAIADTLDIMAVDWHGKEPVDVLDAWEENHVDSADDAYLTGLLADGRVAIRDDVEGFAHAWAMTGDDGNETAGCGCPLDVAQP